MIKKKKQEYKVCTKCGDDKPTDEFPKKTAYGGGEICNICLWDTFKKVDLLTYAKVAKMLMGGATNAEIKRAIPVTKEGILQCKIVARRYMRENNMIATF